MDAIVSPSEVASLTKIFFFFIFSFKFAYWGQVARLGSGQVHDLTLCNNENFFESFKEVAEDFKIKSKCIFRTIGTYISNKELLYKINKELKL